jgi:hypothetical protein
LIALVLQSPLLGDPVTFAETVKRALENVVHLNCATLLAYPSIPDIYASGVVWQFEPPGEESIVDIPAVLLNMFGDCAHVAAWRCAELNARKGEPEASLRITWLIKDPKERLQEMAKRIRALGPERLAALGPDEQLRLRFMLQKLRDSNVRKRLFHVQITRKDGRVEDPSVMLGMPPNVDFPLDYWPTRIGEPIWVRDSAIWRRAEKKIWPHRREYVAPYAAVSHVYKKMGGRVGAPLSVAA